MRVTTHCDPREKCGNMIRRHNLVSPCEQRHIINLIQLGTKLISVQTFSSEQHIPADSYYSFLQVHIDNFQAVKENKGKN